MKATLKKINEYLQSKVPALELVKGRGYFYFADADPQKWGYTHHWALPPSIYIYALRQQSLEAWKRDMDKAVSWYGTNN